MIFMTESQYLLDTCVFIDYLRGKPAAREILSEIRTTQAQAGYSIITEAELWAGITAFRTEAEHIALLKPFNRYFVNVTIARRAGELYSRVNDLVRGQKGEQPAGLSDCLIAATADYHALTVWTRNQKHFKHFQHFGINVRFYTL